MKKIFLKVFAFLFAVLMLCSCAIKQEKTTEQKEEQKNEPTSATEGFEAETTSEPSATESDLPEPTAENPMPENTAEAVGRTTEDFVKLEFDEAVYFDMDANGIPEKITMKKQKIDGDDFVYAIYMEIVENEDGLITGVFGEETGGFYDTTAFVARVDKEDKDIGYILVSNTYASDDPYSFCLGLKDRHMVFRADGDLVKNLGFYIDDIQGGSMKCKVRSDYLGTGWYYREYVINDLFAEAIDSEKYYFTDYENPNETFALTAKTDLKYIDADGKEAVLSKGTKIYREAISPENMRFYFRLLGEDHGGYFELEGSEGELKINGMDEWDCFNVIFYFD